MRLGFLSTTPKLPDLALLWEILFLLNHTKLSSNTKSPRGAKRSYAHRRDITHIPRQPAYNRNTGSAATKAHIQHHWHTTHLQGSLMILKYLCHLINAAIHSRCG